MANGGTADAAIVEGMDRTSFTELADRLRDAAAAYYSGDGTQTMDDATYDAGIRQLRGAAEEHGWDDADDLLYEVAGGQGAASADVPHVAPMLSLENAMDPAEERAFLDRVANRTGVLPERIGWVVEPKFDGMALEVVYHDGLVARIVTRGNGQAGEDVGHLARKVSGIPAELPNGACVAVIGECVMTHEDFAAANELRLAHGDKPFANPRNAVAGSLRAKHRDYVVPMTFIAYGAHAAALEDPTAYTTDPMPERYTATIGRLAHLGFKTAQDVIGRQSVAYGPEQAMGQVAWIEQKRSTFPMDTDGAVIKANDPHIRQAMGEGSRAPRWAIAVKFSPDTRETDLLDIEVAVGRTGNLSFTAKVAPVAVGGATIGSVTVHNVSEIARKGLRLPGPGGVAQRVVVRRAGEVIPEIVGVASNGPDESQTRPFEPPELCPNGHALDTTNTIWRCVLGRGCGVAAGIRYAVSRDCLDIEGMGTQIVDALVASGAAGDVADLFALSVADLLAVPRLGRTSSDKILEQIDRARSLPLARILTALGIRGTGRSMSRRIASHFGTMAAVRAATVEQMAEVEGIGPVKAPSIVAELAELAPVIDRMAELGVVAARDDGARNGAPTPPSPVEASSPLAGMSVCVTGAMTGALAGMTRNEVNELIESLGGRAASGVSAKTSLLLTDDPESGSGKAKKARELGIEIVTPDEFARRYVEDGRGLSPRGGGTIR